MKEQGFGNLPQVAVDFIASVIKKMRYRKKVRQDVEAELVSHFEDALGDCRTDEKRQEKAQQLINEFGDAKLLATLIRRGKKRCRPLWVKAIIGCLKVIGVLVVLAGIRVGSLAVGNVNVSVDYIQWLNELASQGRSENLNARGDYIRAVELYESVPEELKEDFPKLPKELSLGLYKIAKEYLKVNGPCLRALEDGARKPYYWPEYSGKGRFDSIMEMTMPSLSGHGEVAQHMRFRINMDMHEGDIDSAINNGLVLLEFGTDMQGKGLLIEQLVGVTIEKKASQSLYDIAASEEITSEQIKRLQTGVRSYVENKQKVYDLQAEKAFWYDNIQRSFTDDGKGSGRPLLKGVPYAVKDWKSAVSGFVLCDFPDRQEVVRRIDERYELMNKYCKESPWEKRNKDKNQYDKDVSWMLIAIQALESVSREMWKKKADGLGLLTAVSVLRYKAETGSYPDSLEDIVKGGYLGRVPEDPFSGEALIYKRSDDDFTVYSIGENFVDNGGVMEKDSDGRKRKWSKFGDFVFWPVGEN